MTIVSPEDVGLSSARLSRIHPVMQRYVDQQLCAGGLTLIARRGQIAHSKSFGMMDVEAQIPMRPDAIFRIYSMSKPITSVAAMILVEEGKLKLDAPVSTYLPELADLTVLVSTTGDDGETRFDEVPTKRPITARDLLRHTSGFTYGFFGNSEVDKRYRSAGILVTGRTLADFVLHFLNNPAVGRAL